MATELGSSDFRQWLWRLRQCQHALPDARQWTRRQRIRLSDYWRAASRRGRWSLVRQISSSVRDAFGAIDPFRRAACLGALVGLFGVAVHGVVDFGLHVTINALVCTVLIVIATLGDGAEKQTPNGRHGGARYAPN